jgi:predicted porin
MKKHILAIALAAAFAAPAAFADVEVGPFTLYGTLQTAVETISVSGPIATTNITESQQRLMDQTSKLGFKVKHDLGHGMFAIGQVESRLYLGNNGSATDDKAELGGRNTFAGIGNGDFGTLRLGRFDNAYKLATKQQSSYIYNNLNDTTADVGDKQILTRLGGRQGDIVAYESPNWGGVTVNASLNLGKDSTNSISGGSTNNTAKNTVATDMMPQTAFGVGYQSGPFSVGYGYTSVSKASWKLDGSSAAKATNNAGSQVLTASQFGGQYTMGVFSIGAVFERTSSALSGVAGAFDQSQNVYGLTGAYKSGPLEVQVRYANASDVSGGTVVDTGADQVGLAFAYDISKNVKTIGSLTKVTNSKNASFTSGSGFALDKGNSMTQLAIGLAVTF